MLSEMLSLWRMTTRVSQAKTLLGKDVGPLSDEIDKNKTQLNDSLIQMGKFVSDVLDLLKFLKMNLIQLLNSRNFIQKVKTMQLPTQKRVKNTSRRLYWHKYYWFNKKIR